MLSYNWEEGEISQYPLKDIWDKYYVNCIDYFEMYRKTRTLSVELENSIGDDKENYINIPQVSKLIGKRIYNKEVNGYAKLKIE